MSPEAHQRVRQLFDEALERPEAERLAFLQAACAGNPEVFGQVAQLLAAHEEAAHLLEGEPAPPRIGRYLVTGELGRGAMGIVYEAIDPLIGRKVAVKIIHLEALADGSEATFLRERLFREARAAGGLFHPGIVVILDVGQEGDVAFIAMEYVEGPSLSEVLAGHPKIDCGEALSILQQTAAALDFAHSKGVVHRDIKPANIMLEKGVAVKVADFGIAKITSSPQLTKTGMTMGTPSYMSPEQLDAKPLDGKSDQFSLAVVAYELLTGTQPFRAESLTALAYSIVYGPRPSARAANPELPAGVDQVFCRGLGKLPEERYPNCREFVAALERAWTPQVSGAEDATPVTVPTLGVTRALPKMLADSRAVPRETGLRRLRLKALAVVVFLLVVAAAAWIYLRWRQSHHLTDKDTIVLADFTNTTGDSIFDGTLRQGLSAQLEQSPFLSLVSDLRIAQTLALMTQPKEARLTQKLAREVCQRTASAATIEGSISSKGLQYVLGLQAVNCRSGDLLAEEQAMAKGKAQVLRALAEGATKMRRKLGESLGSVQKYDVPPSDVTTGSLQALQAYSQGYRVQTIRGDNVAAIPLLRQAIGLDPNFAMAFVTLGACYNNLGQTERAVENTRRAYELRERVSQREKFFIISYYETNATGNLEAARKELGLWAQAYPRDFAAPRQLSNVSNFLGDYQNALAAAQQVLRLDPGNGAAYCGLSINYLALNRLDEARATAREAHNLGAPMADYYLYYIDFLQHDAAGMERDVATLMRKPGYEDLALGMESDTAAYAGKFARARELTRRAAASAERADEPEPAANYLAEAALRDALVGNLGLAMRQAQAGLALSNGRDVEAMSAMALALVGDSNQARRLASDLAKRFPEDTLAQIEYLPMIQACTGLGIGHGADGASKAIAALAVAARYELGVTNGAVLWQFNAPYLRGEAYLAARQGTAAAVEFRKILDHPGMFTTDITAALARLDLGRAYALVGDNAKARTAYQDFLALWKDADPDIPVLNHAKAEYAKLAGP